MSRCRSRVYIAPENRNNCNGHTFDDACHTCLKHTYACSQSSSVCASQITVCPASLLAVLLFSQPVLTVSTATRVLPEPRVTIARPLGLFSAFKSFRWTSIQNPAAGLNSSVPRDTRNQEECRDLEGPKTRLETWHPTQIEPRYLCRGASAFSGGLSTFF